MARKAREMEHLSAMAEFSIAFVLTVGGGLVCGFNGRPKSPTLRPRVLLILVVVTVDRFVVASVVMMAMSLSVVIGGR